MSSANDAKSGEWFVLFDQTLRHPATLDVGRDTYVSALKGSDQGSRYARKLACTTMRRIVFTDESRVSFRNDGRMWVWRESRQDPTGVLADQRITSSSSTFGLELHWMARRNWWSNKSMRQHRAAANFWSSIFYLSPTQISEESRTASSKATIFHHTEQLQVVSWRNSSTELCAGRQDLRHGSYWTCMGSHEKEHFKGHETLKYRTLRCSLGENCHRSRSIGS